MFTTFAVCIQVHEILESVLGEGWYEGKLQEKMESLSFPSAGALEKHESLACEPAKAPRSKESRVSEQLAQFKTWYHKHGRSPRDLGTFGEPRNEEEEEEQRWALWLDQKRQMYQKRKDKSKYEEKKVLTELLGDNWWKGAKAKDGASRGEEKISNFQRFYQKHGRLPRAHKDVDTGKLSQEHLKERELYFWFRDQRKAKVGVEGASKLCQEADGMLQGFLGKDWHKANSHRSSETVQNIWVRKSLKFKEWFQVHRRIPRIHSDRKPEVLNEAEKEERSWAFW